MRTMGSFPAVDGGDVQMFYREVDSGSAVSTPERGELTPESGELTPERGFSTPEKGLTPRKKRKLSD